MPNEQTAQRRSFLLLLGWSLAVVLLVGRLAWIQLIWSAGWAAGRPDLLREAVKQRQQVFIADFDRGPILDRNGAPLTGGEKPMLVVFPLARTQPGWETMFRKAAERIGISPALLLKQAAVAREPTVVRDANGRPLALTAAQAAAIHAMAIPGLAALPVSVRYQPDALARHVIGFLHQNPGLLRALYPDEWASGAVEPSRPVGAAGVERRFERYLQGDDPTRYFYLLDGQGRPLGTPVLRTAGGVSEWFPLSVVTTLDKEIQRRMEAVADQGGLKRGSIVVLDIRTNDALAVVSRPRFDPNHVDAAGGDWQNRAVRQLPPGSVFKTVVAAAALAEGAVSPTETFRCDGEYGKYGFSCWKKEGHGLVTLEEAFAQSCNVAFARIAVRLGGEKIAAYAARLGLTSPAGWTGPGGAGMSRLSQWEGEEAGQVYDRHTPPADEGALIQTAIGQRDVRITPLQAANLMAAIARGGKPMQVRLVSELRYRNGIPFQRFEPQPSDAEGIDPATARKLVRLLRQVVTEGTGSGLSGLAWDTAGKSGTAEVVIDGRPRVHQWFAGFAPARNPRYAIAVVAEDQPVNGPHLATTLFGHAVDALLSRQ